MKQYYVYILANDRPSLYIGVTNDLVRRIQEHKASLAPGFTAKYHIHKLVYFEVADQIEDAIAREKQLKNWHREWKLNLIRTTNPELKEITFEDERIASEDPETSSRWQIEQDDRLRGVYAFNDQTDWVETKPSVINSMHIAQHAQFMLQFWINPALS